MLDTLSVTSSLAVLVALSLPAGYLTVNTFQSRRISGLPFFSLLPLYLAVGVTIQIMVSFLLGTIIISPFVPLSISVGSLAILFLNVYKKNGRHPHLLSTHDLFSKDQTFGNIFSIIVIVVLFASFARIPVATQWPPFGDAIFHSMLTSLAVYNGHIPTDLKPIDSFPYPYPSGYHVFSADLSYILNFNPGESIFILATYFTAIISALLFTLTYVLTKSYWLSLPIPFSILVAHNTGYTDTWISSFLTDGPYPNLFAFIAVITIIVLAQIAYNYRQPIFKITTIGLVILIALFVTYPQFLFHAMVFIGSYGGLQRVLFGSKRNYKKDISAGSQPRTSLYSYLASFKSYWYSRLSAANHVPSAAAELELNSIGINPNSDIPKNAFVLRSSFIVAGVFVLVSILTQLFPFYLRLLTYNVPEFAKRQSSYYLNSTVVLNNFLSDHFFAGLLVMATLICVALIILRGKKAISPLFVGLLFLILTIAAGFSIIYPERTAALVFTLCWPLIAYGIAELSNSFNIPTSRTVVRYLIISVFVITSFYFEMPYIYQLASHSQGAGWFDFTKPPDPGDNYAAATWIKNHVNINDLILNDRSYSSFYIHGFSVNNLTYSFWNGEMIPKTNDLMPDSSIIREMNHIGNPEYENGKTPLPTVIKPIKNEGNSAALPLLIYGHEPFLTLSGSNYTDILAGNINSLKLRKFSVGTWFKTNSNFSSDAYIVNKGGCCSEKAAENMNYGIWMTKDEKIRAGFETSNGTDYFVTSARSYNDGKWHYAITTNDGFEVKLYIDGALADRRLTSGAIPDDTGSQPIRVGANSFNKGQTIDGYFVGNTYDTRIWNRALLSQAMQQELSSVWSYPHDKGLVYDLLRKYDVKYIVIMAELGYRDFTTWGGTGKFIAKPFTTEEYEEIFNSYNFLKLRLKLGNVAIYSVQY